MDAARGQPEGEAIRYGFLAAAPGWGGRVRQRRGDTSAVRELLSVAQERHMMSLVRLLGFTTLACGCVTGHYREIATNREVTYVEEKGTTCEHQDHRRNHTLVRSRFGMSGVTAKAS
jgi:hypothetical protein